MRRLGLLLAFVSEALLAHPGHGRDGLLHFHEFSDGILIGAGLIAAALLVAWARKK
jgi:hypothetical protein